VTGSDALDRLLTSSRVMLVIGPGGVGKTTVAAALGCRAVAEHGRRVLVVTIDPARRLAQALGLEELPAEPVLVPVGEGTGRLWASVVDMARSWDELVRQLASPADADALLVNPLYRTLTTGFIQSHDYIALDQLATLDADDRYDLIIVDTPPATHAIDVLDAPQAMVDFFGSRLLRWLTAPYRSRLAQTTSKPFLAVAERLLGGPFVARLAEFFWLFSRLQPGFVARADRVTRRLQQPSTGYVVVTTSDPSSVTETGDLLDELDARGHDASLVVHNRAVPIAGDEPIDLDAIADPSLRAAMAALVGRDARLVRTLAGRSRAAEVATVPWRSGQISSVPALIALLD